MVLFTYIKSNFARWVLMKAERSYSETQVFGYPDSYRLSPALSAHQQRNEQLHAVTARTLLFVFT